MTDAVEISRLLGPDWTDTRLTIMEDAPVSGGPLRRLAFASSAGDVVPALYLPSQTGAAVLYCHAHGARYHIGMAEVTDGRPALQSPYLADLAARGLGVLCLEMPCFGARAAMQENATAKARLWHGRTLFCQMLGEQRAGLDWLLDRPGVARVTVMGISMGGTLAWWLAALDPRPAAVVSMCCLADMAALIASGAHDIHGNYMTVPGVLALARTGQVAGLAAPKPALHCVGFADPGTPQAAFATARADLVAAYERAGGALQFHTAESPGHEETPAMRARVLAFLDATLPRHDPG